MRSREVLDTSTGDISEYEGPAQDFPFKSIRYLGAGQLIVALLLEILVIVQLSLSSDDRYVFLASASVAAWTPLMGIASGIVGIAMCEERYWETQCMKIAFCVLTSLNGFVFMPILVCVTAIVTAAYYDVTDPVNEDHLLNIPASIMEDSDKDEARTFMVAVYITLGLLQLCICIASLLAVFCCAPLYHLKGRAMQRRLYGAHNPRLVRGNKQVNSTRRVTVATPEASLPRGPTSVLTTTQAPAASVVMAPAPPVAMVSRPTSVIGPAAPMMQPMVPMIAEPVMIMPANPHATSQAPSIFLVD